jgi:hypothetical protein
MKKLFLILLLLVPLFSYGSVFNKKKVEIPKKDTIEAVTEILVYEPIANRNLEKRMYYSIVIYNGSVVEKIFIMRTINGQSYYQEIDIKKWHNIIKQEEIVIFD